MAFSRKCHGGWRWEVRRPELRVKFRPGAGCLEWGKGGGSPPPIGAPLSPPQLEKSVRRLREKFHGKVSSRKAGTLMRKFGSDHTGVGRSIVYGERGQAGVPAWWGLPRRGGGHGLQMGGRGLETLPWGGSGDPKLPQDLSRVLPLHLLSPPGVKQKDGQELSHDLEAQVNCLPLLTGQGPWGGRAGGTRPVHGEPLRALPRHISWSKHIYSLLSCRERVSGRCSSHTGGINVGETRETRQ